MESLETAVQTVLSSGQYQLLQRLDIDKHPGLNTGITQSSQYIGICLDTETTGLTHGKDKIIELGMVSFEYIISAATIQIIRIIGRYNGFEDPHEPLTEAVINLTNITDKDLLNEKFDDDKINAMLSVANIIIAHNSAFDRPFMEDRFPITIKKRWACSMADIEWTTTEHISTRTLEYLLFKCGGWFIDGAHRALNDAEGVLALLMEKLPYSGKPVLAMLLHKAINVTSTRIYAVGAPYDVKDKLKSNGYRWNDGSNGKPKAWWKDVEGSAVSELHWLADDIYPRDGKSTRISPVVTEQIDAFVRYSNRQLHIPEDTSPF